MKRPLALTLFALAFAFAVPAGRSLTLPTPAFSAYVDAQRAVVESPDNGKITLIPRTGTPRTVSTGKGSRFHALHVTPQGRVLAAELDFATCRVRVWDVSAGRPVSTLAGEWTGALGCEEPMGFLFGLAFSPDGKTLYTADRTGLRRWDVTSGRLLRAVPGKLRHVAVSADRVVALGEGGLTVWTPDLSRSLAASGNLGKLCLGSPYAGVVVHGPLVAYSCRDEVRVWHSASGQLTLLPRQNRGADGNDAPVFSPGARFLAADEDTRGVAVWDLSSGKRLAQTSVPAGVQVTDVKFTARRLVVALSDGQVQFYDLTAGLRALPTQQVLTFPGQRVVNVHVTLAVSVDEREVLVSAATPAGQVRVLPLP